MRHTVKGQGISINGGTSLAWKMKLAHAAAGLPVLEFKPLKTSRAMQIALERTRELTALPSRYS